MKKNVENIGGMLYYRPILGRIEKKQFINNKMNVLEGKLSTILLILMCEIIKDEDVNNMQSEDKNINNRSSILISKPELS